MMRNPRSAAGSARPSPRRGRRLAAFGLVTLPSPEHGTEVRLARELTLLDATLLGVGALMGGGIFLMPGLAAAVTGPSVWLALALNAVATLPTLLVYAELGSAYHDTGGGYLWVKDALGRSVGFLGGWMSWFSHATACALYALASAGYLVFMLQYGGWLAAGDPGLLLKGFAFLFTVGFVALNYVGVKLTAKAENATTVIVLGVLGVFIGFGLLAIAHHPADAVHRLHLGDWGQMLPFGFTGVFLTMGLTFIAFEGYEIIAQAGEEVKDARRNVPLAHMLSLAIIAPLLVLVGIVAVGAVAAPAGGESWQWLASHGELGLVQAADQFIPLGIGALVVVIGAMLSNVVALNSTIYSSSRVSFAMSRDRTLPRFFNRVNPKTRTPDASIVFSGALIALMATSLPITDVAAATDIMFLMLFFLVNLSYLKLRKTTKHLDYGFRAPWFPYLAIAGLLTKLSLAVALYIYSPVAWTAALVWLGVGLVVYMGYGRKKGAEPEPRVQLQLDEVAAEPPEGFHVLLPIANPSSLGPLRELAADIARAKGGSVTLLHVVVVPRTTVPSAARGLAERERAFLDGAARDFPPDVQVRPVIQIAHDPAAAILATAEEEHADLILLGWRGKPSLRENILGATLDPVVREAPCDVAVLRDAPGATTGRVVLAARGRGRHARLGAQLAGSVAHARGAQLVALTVVTPHAGAEPEARLASVVADAGLGPWEASFESVRARSAEEGLLRAADRDTLLVLGASEEPAWRSPFFGTLPERVAGAAHGRVLLVKRQTKRTRALVQAVAGARSARGYLRPER